MNTKTRCFALSFLLIASIASTLAQPLLSRSLIIPSTGRITNFQVADTLDLAEHARLALNYIKGNMDRRGLGPYTGAPGAMFPVMDGQPYHFVVLLGDHPFMYHYVGDDVASNGLSAIIQVRNMLGTNDGLEEESLLKNMIFSFIQNLTQGGRGHGTEPGYALDAMVNWYALADEEEAESLKETIDAYVGWMVLVHLSDPYLIDPLVRWYELTGNEAALSIAETIADWVLSGSAIVTGFPIKIRDDGSFIPTPGNESIPGYEPGWDPQGHVESRMRPIAGILRLSILKNDRNLIEWCKRVFDFVDSYTGGIGWYPENVYYNRTGAVKTNASGSETCSIRTQVYFATLLAKAGYPEYWNIVERTARNHLIESQLRNITWINYNLPIPSETSQTTYVNVPERVLGGWAGWSDPNDWVGIRVAHSGNQIMHCCVSGGEALYIVWHNIVTKNETGVYVNLSLNRDTKWVLVNSYRPYEGKVEVLIHDAPTLFVRVPDWVNKADVEVLVDDSSQAFEWTGDYIKLTGLEADQKVTVIYPLREIQETKNFGGDTYTLTWRGDTVVSISPKGRYYPLYQREEMATMTEAPQKTIIYYVPEKEIPW